MSQFDIVYSPNQLQIKEFCKILLKDPLSKKGFTDQMLDQGESFFNETTPIWLCVLQGRLVGAVWAHDIIETNSIKAGWTGTIPSPKWM